MRGTPDFAVTAQRRTTLGIQTLTSTDVENSTPLSGNILRTDDALDMQFSREVRTGLNFCFQVLTSVIYAQAFNET